MSAIRRGTTFKCSCWRASEVVTSITLSGVRFLVGLSSLALALAQGSAALASTVSVERVQVVYTAGAGETNALVLTVEGTDMRVSDPGATISAGAGCRPAGADVLCDVGPLLGGLDVVISLADGDDRADLSSADSALGTGGFGNDQIVGARYLNWFWGNAGNDRLTGGAVEDQLTGGVGNDELIGGRGGDALRAGPGNDIIRAGLGNDFLAGGPGNDLLIGSFGLDGTFASGSGNFRLTPTLLVGEGRDTLSAIESAVIFGGPPSQEINAAWWRGETYLQGGRGDDYVLGGFGPDEIIGGFGNDRLSGRGGRDSVSGGPGVDVLFSRDNRPEQVAGGKGWDAAHVDALDITRGVEAFF